MHLLKVGNPQKTDSRRSKATTIKPMIKILIFHNAQHSFLLTPVAFFLILVEIFAILSVLLTNTSILSSRSNI